MVGGVAANQELRSRLDAVCSERGWEMHVPPPRLCTDQGAMSAWAAIERLFVGSSDEPDGQDVFARYPFSTEERIEKTMQQQQQQMRARFYGVSINRPYFFSKDVQ